MSHDRKSAESPGLTRFVARLCLIVSLWQAPIPFVHSHGSDMSQTPAPITTSDLRVHLSMFHPGWDQSPRQDFGWHCHWILPFWGRDSEERPNDDPPTQPPMGFDVATVSDAWGLTGDRSDFGGISSAIFPHRLPPRVVWTRRHEDATQSTVRQPLNAVMRC